jgi:DNA polymerase-3 subunit alpha (Gram-positive type)
MPFAALEGVGANAAKGIVEARNDAPFSSIEDVRVRSHISKTSIEIMRQHGCFEGMTETDQMMLF